MMDKKLTYFSNKKIMYTNCSLYISRENQLYYFLLIKIMVRLTEIQKKIKYRDREYFK